MMSSEPQRARRLNAPLSRPSSLFKALSLSLGLLVSPITASPITASPITEGAGVWLPTSGALGRHALQWLAHAGDGALYALGAGEVYRLPSSPKNSPNTPRSWQKIGRYSPTLEWDEAEGVSATGPFTSALLSDIERSVGALIEEQLETQGDETWLSEDSVAFLIEAFEGEEDPPLDSPYRVSGLYPNSEGVWVATGAGVWGTNKGALVPLVGSPNEVRSVTQAHGRLWASTTDALWSWSGVIDEPWVRREEEMGGGSLTSFQGALWLLSANALYRLEAPNAPLATEYASKDGLLDLFEGGGRLWLLTTRQLWVREGSAWRPCQRYESSPTHARWSEGHLIAVSPHQLWVSTERCEPPARFERPRVSGLGLRDALISEGQLYAATTQGLFTWRVGDQAGASAPVSYLKRALSGLPSFDELYLEALQVSDLNPRDIGFGSRPVLSALMPDVRAFVSLDPNRRDEVPTFSQGNRQLTLLQPVPQYQVMFEWDLSFEFLARLINPELGSAYSEVQSQLTLAQDQPGADLALEDSLGIPDDWSDDTYTTQAQRLAATTVALQRRQAHRDRAALRSYMHRLYREWVDLIYRAWLAPPPPQSEERLQDALRAEELAALLNALTAHRFSLKTPLP